MMFKPKLKYKPVRSFSVEEDGFFGEYYEPAEVRFPGKTMVVCSGSDGSFLLTQLGAEKFYEAGMPIIALAYWNALGTPEDVVLSPVEYLQKACLWLKDKGYHPGVWGISLGGLYVLLSGSLFHEIECVVVASPVHILFQGGSFTHGLHFAVDSPFSFNGKGLPYVRAKDPEGVLKQTKRNLLRKREPDMLFYYNMLKEPHNPAADVKVENIKGPVLLISGGADVMVPAEWVCREVMRRLDDNGFPYPHKHLHYEILSHYTCPLRPMTSFMFRVERKHKKQCDENRAKSWEATLSFLAEEWNV